MREEAGWAQPSASSHPRYHQEQQTKRRSQQDEEASQTKPQATGLAVRRVLTFFFSTKHAKSNPKNCTRCLSDSPPRTCYLLPSPRLSLSGYTAVPCLAPLAQPACTPHTNSRASQSRCTSYTVQTQETICQSTHTATAAPLTPAPAVAVAAPAPAEPGSAGSRPAAALPPSPALPPAPAPQGAP